MKQKNKDLLIVVLVLVLVWSVLLNWFQDEQVDRLMKQVEDMEYLQTVLTSQVEELECDETFDEFNE